VNVPGAPGLGGTGTNLIGRDGGIGGGPGNGAGGLPPVGSLAINGAGMGGHAGILEVPLLGVGFNGNNGYVLITW
jgi:hypothetical protein